MSLICDIKAFHVVSQDKNPRHNISFFRSYNTGVDFEISQLKLECGKMYALVGPSGAGKSILISLLCGFPPFLESQVVKCDKFRFFNMSLERTVSLRIPRFLRTYHKAVDATHIIYLPQALPTDKSCSVKCCAAMKDVFYSLLDRRTKVTVNQFQDIMKDALLRFNLQHVWKQDLTSLSGGERRRIELLTRLASMKAAKKDRVLVVLDEPTTGFDAYSQFQFLSGIREQLKQLLDENLKVTVVISTHAMHYVSGEKNLFDSVILMNSDKDEDSISGVNCQSMDGSSRLCAVVEQFDSSDVESRIKGLLDDENKHLKTPFLWREVFEQMAKRPIRDLVSFFDKQIAKGVSHVH